MTSGVDFSINSSLDDGFGLSQTAGLEFWADFELMAFKDIL